MTHPANDPTVSLEGSSGAFIEIAEAHPDRGPGSRRVRLGKVEAETSEGGDGAVMANGNAKASDPPLAFEPGPDREVNPNRKALKDVKKFWLSLGAFPSPNGISTF